jgi:hypothetical protein
MALLGSPAYGTTVMSFAVGLVVVGLAWGARAPSWTITLPPVFTSLGAALEC